MKRGLFSSQSPTSSYFGAFAGLSLLLLVALLLGSCAAFPQLACVAPAAANWPTQGWRSTTPENKASTPPNWRTRCDHCASVALDIHSLLIIRNGQVLADATYSYDGKTVHEVASVTKSIMTTLIGIAADQGS